VATAFATGAGAAFFAGALGFGAETTGAADAFDALARAIACQNPVGAVRLIFNVWIAAVPAKAVL
jgi:hypothetical protein